MTPFQPRAFYGARLEPETAVLHGAGQSPEAFETYLSLCGPQQTLPLVYMTYLGVKMPPERMRDWVAGLGATLNRWPTLPLMPQIGLSMTKDGTPELHYEHDVAAGLHDESLHTLFEELRLLGRPFFLRIGYECNGPWNGYDPAAYRDAFAHVTRLLREHQCPAATVWCIEPWEIDHALAWCPEDSLADWWSVDWFDPAHFDHSVPFLEEAHRRGKPVMIGESSPRRLGTDDPAARWDLWYEPYFRMLRDWPGIKAFCYINWDWTRYPMWADWGDSRLEASPDLSARWLEALRSPLIVHA